jgi:hypothetical protein
MLIAITIWLVSLAFIVWVIGQTKEEIEKILIDNAWESFTSLKVFKFLFALVMVLFAPIIAVCLAAAYIKD